jgi:hypothetical protein
MTAAVAKANMQTAGPMVPEPEPRTYDFPLRAYGSSCGIVLNHYYFYIENHTEYSW